MERPSWAPEDIDLERPSVARVYDFYLGGSHNFAVDRELGRRVIETFPLLPKTLQENRAFLRRAVRFCVEAGIRQFLDIGSGIPTVGNVHEVAQQVDPTIKVVYVDIDPVAVAHSRAILKGNEYATAIRADFRQPEVILSHPELQRLIDLRQPVALLLVALLHFFPDTEEVQRTIARFRDALASGSYLVISHASADTQPTPLKVAELYARSGTPMAMRTKAEIARFFEGFELVEPGLVLGLDWRLEPEEAVDDNPERHSGYCGVGKKP